MKLKAVFVSDLHLNDPDDLKYQKFLFWLDRLKDDRELTHLFLLGDIFDLWLGSHSYFVTKHHRFISALASLKAAEVEIHYFEGNHDLYLQPFWGHKMGVCVHRGPLNKKLGPWQVRLEHGDQMDPTDRGYLFLRWFLRTTLIESLARVLPGWLVCRIGKWASQKSRHYTTHIKTTTASRTEALLQDHAELMHRVQAFDYIISGHVHYRYLHKFPNYVVVNLGSWDTDAQYFEITKEGGRFHVV